MLILGDADAFAGPRFNARPGAGAVITTLADLTGWLAVMPKRFRRLAGHFALRYDVEPENAFETAKQQMSTVIREDCRRDIGGDEQRVQEVRTQHDNVTFKLMLLPVWIATYLYAGRTFLVLINGHTGEVQGDRPYSKLKISLAILAVVAVVALIIILVATSGH